jgi:hypothetical protein
MKEMIAMISAENSLSDSYLPLPLNTKRILSAPMSDTNNLNVMSSSCPSTPHINSLFPPEDKNFYKLELYRPAELKKFSKRRATISSTQSTDSENSGRSDSSASNSSINSGKVSASSPLSARRRSVIFYPLSKEALFWVKLFPNFLDKPREQKTFLQALLDRILITPLTNLTSFSLVYQLYLNEIFHTHILTKISHYAMMPIVNIFIAQLLAQFSWFGMNGAAVYCIILWLWYSLWGISSSAKALSAIMVAPLITIYYISLNFYQVTRNFAPNHAWYNSSSHLLTNPIILMFLTATAQAFGHVFEPKLPPRIVGQADWISLEQLRALYGPVGFYFVSLVQLMFGAFDELLASPRLLPIIVLRAAYFFGYNAEQWKLISKLSELAMKSGNPALDYVGIGGDLSISQATKLDSVAESAEIGTGEVNSPTFLGPEEEVINLRSSPFRSSLPSPNLALPTLLSLAKLTPRRPSLAALYSSISGNSSLSISPAGSGLNTPRSLNNQEVSGGNTENLSNSGRSSFAKTWDSVITRKFSGSRRNSTAAVMPIQFSLEPEEQISLQPIKKLD